MKTMTNAIFATALSLLIVIPVYADHPYHKVSYWEQLQRLNMRIEQGIDTRELTRKEAGELKDESRRIRRMIERFRKDGLLSRKERHQLDYELDRLSDLIIRYKHNNLERHRKPKYRDSQDRHDDRWGREPYVR